MVVSFAGIRCTDGLYPSGCRYYRGSSGHSKPSDLPQALHVRESQGDRIVPLPYATQTSRWQAWAGTNASSRGDAARRVRESRRGMRAPRHRPWRCVWVDSAKLIARSIRGVRWRCVRRRTQRLAVGGGDDRSVGRPRHRSGRCCRSSSVIPTGWSARYVSPTGVINPPGTCGARFPAEA
jgi:hypothetical protein